MSLKILFVIFLILHCWSGVYLLEVLSKRSLKVPASGDKLACDNGEMTIECSVGTSVYVVSAVFGRTEHNSVCVRTGSSASLELCRSPDALQRSRRFCLGRRECVITVDEENLGIPLTAAGTQCGKIEKYLTLKYMCLADCRPPRLGSGVAIIGNNYATNSNLTVKCGEGYEPTSNGLPVDHITCAVNGSWSGGMVSCRDIDECREHNSNECDRHADCRNTLEGYVCTCGAGYHGDGFTCNPPDVNRTWIPAVNNDTYNIVTDSDCGGRIFENSGILQSPNYPSSYPKGANCQWVISVAPPQIIEIKFLNFLLEGESGLNCAQDYLIIYDGPNQDPEKWLATYCGGELPDKVKSTRNQIRLEFKSDREASYKGFRATYRGYNPMSVCENFYGPAYEGVVIEEGNTNDTASAGDVLTLGCDEGYNVTENSYLERVCNNDNTWNDLSNPCTAIRCEEPSPYDNPGVRLSGSYEDYRYNGPALVYSCDSGFNLVANPGVQTKIYCNKHGRWSNEGSDEFPSCEPTSCQITRDMAPPSHGSWDLYGEDGQVIPLEVGDVVRYNSTIEYSCSQGYELIGDPKRICKMENGVEWSGHQLVCEEDNGVPGLTNFHIALMAAIISGVVIILVGAGLLYCCFREKRQRRKQKRRHFSQGGRQANYDNQGFIRSNAVEDFTYTPAPSTNPHVMNPSYNYARRPYLLPSMLKASAPTWDGPHQNNVHIIPTSQIQPDQDWRRPKLRDEPSQHSSARHSRDYNKRRNGKQRKNK